MIYLYVPFSQNEGNNKLMKHAKQWYKTAYEQRSVPCTILSSSDVFTPPQSADEKNKIYILAYKSMSNNGEIASSPNSLSPSIINSEQLADRLLTSGLPAQGQVEIKLCIRQTEVTDDSLLISAESIKEHLLKSHYENPQLLIRVEYSMDPFPGETSKLAYYNVNGSIPLLFYGNVDSVSSAEVNSVGNSYSK